MDKGVHAFAKVYVTGRLKFKLTSTISGSMAESRPKGPRLRLGELQYWHPCPPCIALDLGVQFKLYAGIRVWTQIVSSGPHCTKRADDQHRPAGFEPRLLSDLPLPQIPTINDLRIIDLVSSPVWWEAETNIGPPSARWAALITLYSTRHPGPVQAIIGHLCRTHVRYRVSTCPSAV